MAVRPTYDGYLLAFPGTETGQGFFDEALSIAEALVRDIIWPNAPEDDDNAYVRALYAAIRADEAMGGGHGLDDALQSVSAGGVSLSAGGSVSGVSSTEAAMREQARRELVGSGLLYRCVSHA